MNSSTPVLLSILKSSLPPFVDRAAGAALVFSRALDFDMWLQPRFAQGLHPFRGEPVQHFNKVRRFQSLRYCHVFSVSTHDQNSPLLLAQSWAHRPLVPGRIMHLLQL